MLKYKAGPLLAQAEEQAKRDRRAALYGQLNKTRWPMTKLMAEVAASTPVGISVDRVVLSPEAEYGLSISGTADSLDSLEQLQANLNRTGLISSLKADKTEAASNGVSFTRSAKVSDPLVRATLADDFAAKPLRDRIYNEDGTRIRNSAARIDDAPDTSSDRGEDRPRSGPRSAPSTPKAAASLAPLSDTDIAAMDYATAMKEWSARLGPSRTDPDPTVKARLAEEVKKLDTQRKKDKSNPPSAAPAPAPKPAETTPAAEGTPTAQPAESAPATPPPPPPAESERPASTGGVA